MDIFPAVTAPIDLAALWARVQAHVFDDDQPLPFTFRLARDTSWSAGFAAGAVEEYRRFCFLAVAAGAPVTPSEEVDEVWHLHLTYTRDYWERWCGEVLQARLHHDPTKGGEVEQRRFREQYARTLLAYEGYFGPPPEVYWPATHVRFGAGPRYRTLDTHKRFSLPRPAAWLAKLWGRG